MNEQIERIKKISVYLIDMMSDLSVDQLNEVPEGFNNNIIWNLGHLIAVQQGVCYIRGGVNPVVDEKYIKAYKPGTRPEQFIVADEVEIIKKLLISSLDEFKTDYANNVFANYGSWTTRYGVTLLKIEDAVEFLMFHEGLHSGYAIALKRMVKK